ncbi:MAG: DUF3164 family protein [Candidatus Peribacteria bacterium]|jgi:hypothetical protein|nr:DUF3164 family protein [Candidatus Peribacteria bacterium]
MDLNKLTEVEKDQLLKQLAEEKKLKKQQKEENKEALKELQNEFVNKFFGKLLGVERDLREMKSTIFENAGSILELKQEILGMSDEAMKKQQSHSISNSDYSKTIIIGHNTVDGWDMEQATSGIEKVNNWLEKQLKSNSKDLIAMIRDLLKPNKEGLLKANRVMELSNRANKIGDSELIEAVSEIQQAYHPRKTTTFVKAKYRDKNDQDVWLCLSMSNA